MIRGLVCHSLTFSRLAVLVVVCFSIVLPSISFTQDWSKEQKVTAVNLAGIAGVTAWGIANWDYFGNSPKSADEGWFSKDTPEGGADKWAHFYFSYTLSHILAGTYDNWGYDRNRAALLGSLSSFGIMGYMEFGDSFSNYGFSKEDFAMNMFGCAAGFLLYRYPSIAKKIDFRIEYIPRFDDADLVSDYEHMKFLMAVKPAGFNAFRKSRLRPFELQLGYYARGYPDDLDKERNIYFGVGLSLPYIFSRFSMKKTAKVFNYYQLPYTYMSYDRDLN
ncbi:MAG: YfiM family protein [Desulfobacterales bacterium]|nr:YfiM family protein [Desulfobacterales bacterium]